ncbi:MAG: fibronectin type III domain-containing protein, partial [bacterium]
VTVTPSVSSSNMYSLSWPEATAGSGMSVTHYYYMINTAPPSTLATVLSNVSTYFDNETSTSVDLKSLPGVNKGANIVYVVAIDNSVVPNYSPSNYITGTFTLNSTDPDNVGNLVSSDSSIKSQSKWNVTLTWTEPTYMGAGNLTYQIYRSGNGISFSKVGETVGLSYVDNTPLSQMYYYKVYTKDGANAVSSGTNAVSIFPTGKWTSPASLESEPIVSDITTKKAKISWGTDRISDSKVALGTRSGEYSEEEFSNSNMVTNHVINLTNLSPSTTYYFVSKWTDEDGNTGKSTEKTFVTDSAPVVKSAITRYVSIDSAQVEFISIKATKIKLYYGLTTSFGGVKELSTSTNETKYSISLDGLQDGSRYYYKLNQFDLEGNEYQSSIYDFSTLPKPLVSDIRIQQIKNTADTTIVINWNSNTEISSILSYYPIDNPSDVRDSINLTLINGAHKMSLSSLFPEKVYVLSVKGRDRIGNEAVSENIRFTTATDTRPPVISEMTVDTAPVGSSNTNSQKSQIVVSWNTDELSTSSIEYGEGYSDTYQLKSTTDYTLTYNHAVVISGLEPSKVYHFRSVSKDKANNTGYSSNTVSITSSISNDATTLILDSLRRLFNF